MRQVVVTVVDNIKVMPNTYLIWLEATEIASLAKPGQFVMVGCGGETVLPRPMSIHQRDGNRIALLFNVVGIGTNWLSQQQEGDMVELFGPLGNGFTVYSGLKNLLLVAGGVGIAPLPWLAQEALNRGYSLKLLLGASTVSQLYGGHTLPSEVKPIIATEDVSAGKEGLVTGLLLEYANWADQVFACGPVGMYRTMAGMLELMNKPVQVSLEVRMGCGRGVCYGCTIKTKQGLKRVCEDGPVFNLDDVIWDEVSL